MRKATFCLLVIATVTLLGGVPAENVPQADPAAKLDAVLQRAVDSGPGAFVSALVELRSGARTPEMSGVAFGSRFGDVVTVRTSCEGLLRLASHRNVVKIRHSSRVSLRGDVAGVSAIGFRGSYAGGAADSYSYAGVVGETITVTAHGESGFDPDLTVAGTNDAANSGPGTDDEVSLVIAATPVTIAVGADAGTGSYVLVIKSSRSVSVGDLTGGDIVAGDSAYYLGTRAAASRATNNVDGTGVVIGFVDSGIDFSNEDFRNADGTTRLLYIWDQTLVAEPDEVAPSGYGYGVEYNATMINNHLSGALPSYVRHGDADGHGTHVAGIAAGDGSADSFGATVNNQGAAPGASLIMVRSLGSDANVLDGVSYVIAKAQQHGMPVVVNLSLGGHDGPHDGTTMLDEALASIDRVGVGLVVAAGNEGDSSRAIHDQMYIPAITSAYFRYDPDDTAVSFPGTTNHIVISEVKTASSVSDSDFEFVELYNPTDSPVVIGGWDLAYKSAFGTTWDEVVSFPQGSVIAAHGFFLIGGPSVTPVPDVITTNLGLGDTSGHVVLRDDDDKTIDLLGWGSADSPESNAAAAPPTDGSMERDPGAASPTSGNGVDTGDNAADFTTRVTAEPQSTASGTETPLPPHIIDLWADGNDSYAVEVSDGTGAGTFSAGDGTEVTIRPDSPNREFVIENRIDTPSNGDNHIRITLYHEGPLAGVAYIIRLTRVSGTGNGLIDAYVANEPDQGAFSPASMPANADTSMSGTIAQPGTAGGGVLTVGAYVSKYRWDHPAGTEEKASYLGTDAMGNPRIGNVALFSSRGPTRDGRLKPDICAPGAWIASSLSSSSTPTAVNQTTDGTDADATSEYEHRTGTSMAAPAVSGMVALLLHHNPGLTTKGIKNLVMRTALTDSQTDNYGGPYDTHWGAGKVNAIGLLQAIGRSVPMEVENSCVSAVSTAKAGSGGPARALLVLFLAVLLGRVFSLRRKVQEKAS